NINGIQPYIQRYIQKPINSFFHPKSNESRDRETKPGINTPTADLRAFLGRHGWPQMLFLNEVKIAPSDTQAQRAVHTAINPQNPKHRLAANEPTYTAHFNLPTDPYNATGFGRRVHGIASLIRDDFAASFVQRVRNVDWDAEGRIQVIEAHFPIPSSSSSKVAIFNVYLVNGTSYAYKSPKTGAVIGTRHDRKREVHRLLQQECRAMMREGWEVVIAGDVNVARSELDGWPRLRVWPEEHVLNRQDFERRFFDEGLGLVDSFRWMHDARRGYTYYPRSREWGSSCDRVDLIMLSRGLVNGELWTLKKADIFETPQERGLSDHVPLFVELDLHAKNNKLQNISKCHAVPLKIV
ncbi:DNase I-like protein, partial [Viridothelium virens]